MLDISIEKSRAYQEIRAEGYERGERSLILRQLTRRFGALPQVVRDHIEALPLATLESLGDALLDFGELANLQAWLEALPKESEE